MPRMIQEALKLYGVKEIAGEGNNPTILKWADEIGGWGAEFYNKDSIPWCGLFTAIVAKRAGKEIPKNYFSALAWASFGTTVKTAMLGDILTFTRQGGGHVGIYVGEDKECYHVLGGNQSDSVNITRIKKSRLYSIQRPKYNKMPDTVKQYTLTSDGVISSNEE